MSNNTSPSYNLEDEREHSNRDNNPNLLSGLLLNNKNTINEDPEYYKTLNQLIQENSHKSVWEVCKEYENKMKNEQLNKNQEPQTDTPQKDSLSSSKSSSKKNEDDDEVDEVENETISILKDDDQSIIYSDSDFMISDRFIHNIYKEDAQENEISNNNNFAELSVTKNKNELEQFEEFNLRNKIDIDEVYSKSTNYYNNKNDINKENYNNKINGKSDKQSNDVINLVDTESNHGILNLYQDKCEELVIPFTKKATAHSVNTNPSIVSITSSQNILKENLKNEANKLKSIRNEDIQSTIKNPPKNIIEKEVFYQDEYLPDIPNFQESETLEYKNYHLPIHISGIKCIMKTVNAFLNTKGGRIYFGVNNFRQVKGIAANSAEIDDLCNVLINLTEDFSPSCRLNLVQTKYFPVMNSWNDTVIKDLYVVVLIISPGDKFTLYSVNSNCYVSYLRINSQNIYLKASDIESEFKKRISNFWDIKNQAKEANNEQEKLLGRNIEIQSFQSYNSECIGSIKSAHSNLRNNKEIISPINNNIKPASPLNTHLPLVGSKDMTSNINNCYSPTIPLILTKTNNNGIKDYDNNSISIVLPLSNELEDKLQMEKTNQRKNKAPVKKVAQESNKKCVNKSKKTNNVNTENQIKPISNVQESQDRINRIKRQMRLNKTKNIFLENNKTNMLNDSKDEIVRNPYSNTRNRKFSDQICGSPYNKFDKQRNNKKNAKIINYDNKNIDENMNYHDIFKLCGNNVEEHSKSQVSNEDTTFNKDDTVIEENLTQQPQNQNNQERNKTNEQDKPNKVPQSPNSQAKSKNDVENPYIVPNKGRTDDLDFKPTTNIFHIEEIYGNSNKEEYKPVTSNASKRKKKDKEIEDPNDPYIIKNLALIHDKKEEKVKRPRKLYNTNNFAINKSNLRKRQSKKNEFTFNFLNKKKAKEVPDINTSKAPTNNNFNSYYSNNITSLITKAQKTNKKQANKKFDMISLIEEEEEEERSLENNPYIQISFDDRIYGDIEQDKKNDKKDFEKQTQKNYSYKSLFLKKNNAIKNINNTSKDQIDVIDNIIFNSSGSSGLKNSCSDFFIDLGIDNSK